LLLSIQHYNWRGNHGRITMKQSTIDSLERIWARSTSHYMGENDHDAPQIPILTMREARISLVLRTVWVSLHVSTCLLVMAGVLHHW